MLIAVVVLGVTAWFLGHGIVIVVGAGAAALAALALFWRGVGSSGTG